METTLWGWGLNAWWELGIGDSEPRTRPSRIDAPTGFKVVHADDQRSFGIDADGSLWAWGDEVGGRLGLSETDGHADHPMNASIPGTQTLDIASGKDYSYARVAIDGVAGWVWWGRGRNDFMAALGDFSDPPVIEATPFPYQDVARIAAFWEESIGITGDGRVFTWRPNRGPDSLRQVHGFEGAVTQVDLHGGDAAALDESGRVYLWKLEDRWEEALDAWTGELKGGFSLLADYRNLTSKPRRVFSDVPGVFRSVTITSGGVLLALHESGDVWAAGPNRVGEIAGAEKADWIDGARIEGLPPAVQVAGCKGRGFAVDHNRRVWTWGSQLAPPVFPEALAPTLVVGLEDVIHISAHSGNFLAVAEPATRRRSDLAADSTAADVTARDPAETAHKPESIPRARSAWKGAAPLDEHAGRWDERSGVEVELPTDVVAVASGGGHCLALRSNGTVVGWGTNHYGQADVPTDLKAVTAIAAGDSHSLALKADGTVVAWGSDLNGQASVPAGASNAVAIFAGGQESAAFLRDGSLLAWGAIGSTVGRVRPTGAPFTAVGLGDTHFLVLDADGDVFGRSFELQSVYKPVAPPRNLSGIKAVTVGSGFCLAMRRDGSLLAWGRNDYGQTNVPLRLANVRAISAGGSVSLALTNDGRVVTWGGDPDPDEDTVPMPDGLTDVTAIAAGVQCVALRADGSLVVWGKLRYMGW